jgi:hypothetical protein
MTRSFAVPPRSLTLGVGAALCLAALPSRAVSVNPDGDGQVLLFPYYTVNGGKQTVVSVTNTDARAKALRVRFREAHDGRPVLELNLYLDAGDSWTAAVFDEGGATHPAALLTRDTACTVPPIRTSTALPQTAGGDRYAGFRNFNYSGFNVDGGPTGRERTREGFFEVIEMGTLRPDSPPALSAAVRSDGMPADCTALTDAQLPGGYWAINSSLHVDAPRGGLTGYAAIVDVAAGTSYSVEPTALDDFRDAPMHAPIGESRPTLADARSAPDGVAAAQLRVDGQTVVSTYPADRAIDAVSAVLQSDQVVNEFVRDAAVGARTDWVVTFPTRQFYSDRNIVGDAVAPFARAYWGSERAPEASCERTEFAARDRNARPIERYRGLPCLAPGGECPGPDEAPLCGQVTILSFGASSPLDSAQATPLDLRPLGDAGGYARLLFDAPAVERHALRPSLEGHVHAGLPVVGFAATQLVNGELDGDTLANYADTRRNRVRRRCEDADGSCAGD